MADYPYMPLWVGDYLKDTRHLGAREHGAYLLLLMEAWRRPSCSLPDDDALLARWAAVTPDEWAEIKPLVMRFWKIDGRKKEWVNSKQCKVRVQAKETSRKQAGRAASRWKNNKKGSAAGEPRHCRGNANTQSPKGEKEGANAPSQKRATRLPPDWQLPHEWGEWALTNTPLSADRIRDEAERMRNWSQYADKGACKDWFARWRNWCKSATPSQPPRGPRNGRRSTAEIVQFFSDPADGAEGEAGMDCGPDQDPPRALLAARDGR